MCRVEPRWRRSSSDAKATSSFESVDTSCSFGVGVSLVDAVRHSAGVGNSHLLKYLAASPRCLTLPRALAMLQDWRLLEAGSELDRAHGRAPIGL